MVFLRLEVELSERERETAQLKGWSRGQIDDARELSGAAWWCLAIGCGFPRHALTEDGRRAAKASLDTQHAKTGNWRTVRAGNQTVLSELEFLGS